MPLERPRITRIHSVTWETDRRAPIAFEDQQLAASPAGTFCMVWVPGVDEVPMGTGANDDGRVTLTIEAKGDCTQALLALPAGAKIGVRGPYGTGFRLPATPGPLCFVGGGTGIAPMGRGAQQAVAAGHDVTVIGGARQESLLLLHEHMGRQAAAGTLTYEACTDDGSHGHRGTTVDRLCAMLDDGIHFDAVYACGPEPMMVAVTQLCTERGIDSQASLERYMKCAVGICDACTVGDGIRLCVEGPVLDAEVLAGVPEYGGRHRDACGILRP